MEQRLQDLLDQLREDLINLHQDIVDELVEEEESVEEFEDEEDEDTESDEYEDDPDA